MILSFLNTTSLTPPQLSEPVEDRRFFAGLVLSGTTWDQQLQEWREQASRPRIIFSGLIPGREYSFTVTESGNAHILDVETS